MNIPKKRAGLASVTSISLQRDGLQVVAVGYRSSRRAGKKLK
jgi:hypothetical protein